MKKSENREKEGISHSNIDGIKSDVTASPGAIILGIDPGVSGSLVLTDGEAYIRCIDMPRAKDKDRQIDFAIFHGILGALKIQYKEIRHVFLERAMPMAMGSKGAFNYGRGFEAIVIALELYKFPVTFVEPSKWTKEMHEGVHSDLKPKAKSAIAAQRLYPRLVEQMPRRPKGGMHDGHVDALLIAGYGLRKHGLKAKEQIVDYDFF